MRKRGSVFKDFKQIGSNEPLEIAKVLNNNLLLILEVLADIRQNTSPIPIVPRTSKTSTK